MNIYKKGISVEPDDDDNNNVTPWLYTLPKYDVHI